LWEFFIDEYDYQKNFLGGALGVKAAGDLNLRIIEHVLLTCPILHIFLILALCLSIDFQLLSSRSEHTGCLETQLKDYPEEA
jgi:hypothetical protein